MSGTIPLGEPRIFKGVRALGVLKPKFTANVKGTLFAEELNVRGTAFWLKDYRVMITCAHVVSNLVSIPIEIAGLLVVGNRGNYLRAVVGMVDHDHDLALLRLTPDINPEILEKESSDGLLISDKYPSIGDTVSYSGFPLGNQLLDSLHSPTYAEGVISSQLRVGPFRKELQITGSIAGGFSGAPIVDKTNQDYLSGVISNSPSEAAGSAHIFMAIAWEHVKAIAELSRS